MALDFPASSSSPFTAPNGIVYTWNTDGYWESKTDPNIFDTDYLKLDATNGPVTGPLTFNGLTTHKAGVSVTGGLYDDAARPVVYGNDSIRITAKNSNFSSYVSLDDSSSSGVTISSAHGNSSSSARNLHLVYGGTGHTGGGFNNCLSDIQSDVAAGQNINVTCYNTGIVNQTCTGNVVGYNSSISNTNASAAYNFYAAGDAPNYFSSSLLISNGTDSSGDVNAGSTNGKYIDSAIFYSTRDGTGAQSHVIFRNVNGQCGSIQTDGSNLKISGLAGGPLLRNGNDLDTSEGIIDAVANVVDRINALEANEIIDDATDTSLLQLLANASSRLDSIEARLAALEGA